MPLRQAPRAWARIRWQSICGTYQCTAIVAPYIAFFESPHHVRLSLVGEVLLRFSDRFVVLPFVLEGEPTKIIDVPLGRCQRREPFHFPERVVHSARLYQLLGEVRVKGRVVGVELERAFHLPSRLVGPAHGPQRQRVVEAGACVVRIERNGALKLLKPRLPPPVVPRQFHGVYVMRLRRSTVGFEDLENHSFSPRPLSVERPASRDQPVARGLAVVQ